MPSIAALTTFTANTQAKAAEVNANFSTIRSAVNTYGAFVDLTATISGAWTFSTAPVFTNAQTFAAGVTITTGGLTVSAGASTFGANVTVTGTVAATTFSGSGASLTNLPAAQITGTLGAASGVNLTNLNASNIASGTIGAAYLPSTMNATTIDGVELVTVSTVPTIRAASTINIRNAVIYGDASAVPKLDVRPAASYVFDAGVSGGSTMGTWEVAGSGTQSISSIGQPTGLTTRGTSSDRFFKVRTNGNLDYYIRLERWTA